MKPILVLLLLPALALAQSDTVRSVDRPYVRSAPVLPAPQAAPVAPPPTLGAVRPLVLPTPQVAPRANFSLLANDGDVGKAFERWARERKASVKWLVGRDLPIDAPAEIAPDADDLANAMAANSADPHLVAAMLKVARAFRTSKHPFVIREYDNTLVVVPRVGSRL